MVCIRACQSSAGSVWALRSISPNVDFARMVVVKPELVVARAIVEANKPASTSARMMAAGRGVRGQTGPGPRSTVVNLRVPQAAPDRRFRECMLEYFV
jgi:hypothetical protein